MDEQEKQFHRADIDRATAEVAAAGDVEPSQVIADGLRRLWNMDPVTPKDQTAHPITDYPTAFIIVGPDRVIYDVSVRERVWDPALGQIPATDEATVRIDTDTGRAELVWAGGVRRPQLVSPDLLERFVDLHNQQINEQNDLDGVARPVVSVEAAHAASRCYWAAGAWKQSGFDRWQAAIEAALPFMMWVGDVQ